ncbi:MAG: PAS domain S-box protein [Planctomycetes bacterium]|nr:PAS domain S-box protein [Planctomycetota bacterium]
MSDHSPDSCTEAQSRNEEAQLHRQLEEAQQTLEAIRHGDVDALVVIGPQGEQVYSLAGAEHVYRMIVETMNEAALTVDPEGTILFCNQRFCDLMKTSVPGAMGHKVTRFVGHPQQRPLRMLLTEAQAGPVQRRLLLQAANGKAVPVQLAASPLHVGDNLSLCLVASDLTELEESAHSIRVLRGHEEAMQEANERLQVQMEQLRTLNDMLQARQEQLGAANADLRAQEEELCRQGQALCQSEEWLALAASGTRIGMYDWNVVTGETLWTEQVARLLGLRTTTTTTTVSQRYHYRDWAERVHPEDLPQVELQRRCCMAEQTPYEAEYRVIWPDGNVHWVADRGVFQYEPDGRCIRMLGILMDIADRKRTEEALRNSEQRFRLALQNSPVTVATLDRELRYIWAYHTRHGFQPEDVLGKRPDELIPPEDAAGQMELMQQVLETGVAQRREVCGKTRGIPWVFDFTVEPVFDEQREIIGVNMAAVDITERKQAEAALRELNATLECKVAQRTAELQQRAAQLQKLALELSQAEERERRRIALILHEDLLQQIAGARFHLNGVRSRARDDQLRCDAERVDAMLKEAIEKSRRLSHDLSPAVLNMNDLAEVLHWWAQRVRTQQGLVVRVDVSGAMILQSEALTMFLFRAAQELIFNVVKHARVTEAVIRVRRKGSYVCLSVSDGGQGFNLRELKDTAGLGLLSIRERVKLLGGRMRIRSATGKGSTFRIVVPDGSSQESTVQEDEDRIRASPVVHPPVAGHALRGKGSDS